MKSRIYFITVLFLFLVCVNPSAQVDSLIRHGESLFYNGEFKALYELKDSLINSFNQNKSLSGKRALAKLIAYGYHENFRYTDAAKWYKKVLPLALEDNQQEDLFFSNLNLGKCYTHLDSVDIALKYFKLCGSYLDDYSYVQKYHLNYSLGFFFTRQERFDQAIYYDKNALVMAEAMRDTLKSMSVLYDISYLYDRKGIPDSTIVFLNQLESLLKKHPHPRYNWMVLACRGISNISLKNYKDGIYDLEQSMILGEAIGEDLCCGNRAHLGMAYAEMGLTEKAIKELTIAEGQVFDLDRIDDRRNVLKSLYKGNRIIGSEKKALQYYEIFQATKDSITSQQYLDEVANYQVELGLDQLNIKLTSTDEKLEKITAKNTMLKVGIFILLLSTILVTWMYYHKMKELKLVKDKFVQEFRLAHSSEYSTLPHAVSDGEDRIELKHEFHNRLEDMIQIHLNNDQLSVSLLAQKLGLSKRSLTRKCRIKTGMSPGMFITFIKIEKAKFMLQSTDLNVSEIAYQCGYSDPSYFNKVFKNHTGKTPREWKNKSRLESKAG